MTGPVSTLVLLVTCSLEESRRDLAIEVTKNLAERVPAAGLSNSFVVFDNASRFDDHLKYVPQNAVICRADRNVGYWSAIKWVLDNRRALLRREFDYLYVVESDLYHDDLRALAACERFLANEPRASSVRTQEFSVRGRWRYDKRLKVLPFHKWRSQVSLTNAVSGERAWFRRAQGERPIYLSNLHPKVPALNRMTVMDRVFSSLAAMGDFAETDFFRLTMQQHPLIGVYDKGLFHSLISVDDQRGIVMSSYTDPAEMEKHGYQATRNTRIDLAQVKISIGTAQ